MNIEPWMDFIDLQSDFDKPQIIQHLHIWFANISDVVKN